MWASVTGVLGWQKTRLTFLLPLRKRALQPAVPNLFGNVHTKPFLRPRGGSFQLKQVIPHLLPQTHTVATETAGNQASPCCPWIWRAAAPLRVWSSPSSRSPPSTSRRRRRPPQLHTTLHNVTQRYTTLHNVTQRYVTRYVTSESRSPPSTATYDWDITAQIWWAIASHHTASLLCLYSTLYFFNFFLFSIAPVTDQCHKVLHLQNIRWVLWRSEVDRIQVY